LKLLNVFGEHDGMGFLILIHIHEHGILPQNEPAPGFRIGFDGESYAPHIEVAEPAAARKGFR
jgi:hypothetical protein